MLAASTLMAESHEVNVSIELVEAEPLCLVQGGNLPNVLFPSQSTSSTAGGVSENFEFIIVCEIGSSGATISSNGGQNFFAGTQHLTGPNNETIPYSVFTNFGSALLQETLALDPLAEGENTLVFSISMNNGDFPATPGIYTDTTTFTFNY